MGRVTLWTLIAIGALRGVVPAGCEPAGAARPDTAREQAAAVATAFLREYLTVGDDRAGRRARLAPFLAAGVDVADPVRMAPAGTQYVDGVVPAGVRGAGRTFEVTVLAHVLEVARGQYRNGTTLAFVVPLARDAASVGVSGIPRPAPLPAGPVHLPGRVEPPPGLSGAAAAVAERAVALMLAGDRAGLARLGEGELPEVRSLPLGWRAHETVDADVSGPASAMVADVLVRASPPGGSAGYPVPVRVWLVVGSAGPVVRRVDGGGPVW